MKHVTESRLQIAADKLREEAEGRVAAVITLAENAKPLAEHGINQHCNNGLDNYQVHSEKGGTSHDYLTARIARDNPEVLEKVMKMRVFASG